MPHSGGGGSHRSHGGSRHSSSHSLKSKSYFEGAKKFVYYLNGEPQYYYAKEKYDPKSQLTGNIIFFGIFIFLSLASLLPMRISEGPLSIGYKSEIIIEDESSLIEDKDKLTNELNEFKDKTGIAISVVTKPFEANMKGTTCEDRSYNKYMEMFDNENQWLIYYNGEKLDRSDNWEWNLMCGDNCLFVLNVQEEDRFTKNFNKFLLDNTQDKSLDDCIIDAVNTLKPKIGKKIVLKSGKIKIDGEYVPFGEIATDRAIVFTSFALIMILMMIFEIKSYFSKEKAYLNAKEIEIDKNDL